MYYTPPQFYFIKLKDFMFLHVITKKVKNSVDPDQLVSKKQADLDLHSFQNKI